MIIYFSDDIRILDFDPPPHQLEPLQLHEHFRLIHDADSSHDISTTNILIYSKCTCCYYYYLLSVNKSVIKILIVKLWSVKRRCRSAYRNIYPKNPHHDIQVIMHEARMKYFKDHKIKMFLWKLIDPNSEYIIRST